MVITEVGGTVGDIEILPFLEAIRQFRKEAGRDNVCYVHVTLVPFIGPSGEQKTKPTQHSVTELRSRGIQPDVIVCRSEAPLSNDLKVKISNLCDVDAKAVVNAADARNIYELPLILHDEGLDDGCARCSASTRRPPPRPDTVGERGRARRGGHRSRCASGSSASTCNSPTPTCRSSRRSSTPGSTTAPPSRSTGSRPRRSRVCSPRAASAELDGMVIPGGFGARGIEGKIAAARYAREQLLPCLGLCLGLQTMTIEFARNVLGLTDANSTEFDPTTQHPVIDLMHDQRDVTDKGGTMRLGAYYAVLEPGTKVAAAYGEPVVSERHRHRYEFNSNYRARLAEHGFVCSGTSPDRRLVEFIELADHPYWVGHAGPSRVQEPPGPSAPAVPRSRRRRARVPRRAPRRSAALAPSMTDAAGFRHLEDRLVHAGFVWDLVRRPLRGSRRRARSSATSCARRAPSAWCRCSTATTAASRPWCWSRSTGRRSTGCSSRCRPGCATSTVNRPRRRHGASWPRRSDSPPGTIEPLFDIIASPGMTDQVLSLFVATDCRPSVRRGARRRGGALRGDRAAAVGGGGVDRPTDGSRMPSR